MHNGWYGSDIQPLPPRKNMGAAPVQKCRCGKVIIPEALHGEIRFRFGKTGMAAMLCVKCSEFLKGWFGNA